MLDLKLPSNVAKAKILGLSHCQKDDSILAAYSTGIIVKWSGQFESQAYEIVNNSKVESLWWSPTSDVLAVQSSGLQIYDINKSFPQWRAPEYDTLSFSSDGKKVLLALPKYDQNKRYTIELKDVETGKLIRSFGDHFGEKCSVHWLNKSDRFLIRLCDDNSGNTGSGKTIIWNVDAKKPVSQIDYKRSTNDTLVSFLPIGQDWSVSPGSDLVAVGTNRVDFFRASPWKPEGKSINANSQYSNESNFNASVIFSSDGQRLAICGDKGIASIWDVKTRALLVELKGHKSNVASLAFSPNGKMFATGGADETVRIWNSSSGKELVRLTGHQSSVTAVAFSRDNMRLASGDELGLVKVWDLKSIDLTSSKALKKP